MPRAALCARHFSKTRLISAFGTRKLPSPDLAISCLPVGPATMSCPVAWVRQCEGENSSPHSVVTPELTKEAKTMSSSPSRRMKIGDFLLRRLEEAGVRHLFGVPGDYNLELLQLLQDTGTLKWMQHRDNLQLLPV
jgi:Thiamine pyrophosphate enzyme, N-terminal TPP binding domain